MNTQEEMALSSTLDTASRANVFHEVPKGQHGPWPASGKRGDDGVRWSEHFTAGESKNSWDVKRR